MLQRRPIQISAPAWNAFLDRYYRGRILSITALEPPPWRHPWWTELQWSTIAESWTITVEPGFCLSSTGADPQVTTREDLASTETLERLEIVRPGNKPVDAYLSEAPRVPVPVIKWRPIGTDATGLTGEATESVPTRFAERGVMGPLVLDTSGDGGIVTRVSGLASDRRQARLLRAADLVLTHDRSRAVVESTLDGSQLDIDFSLASAGQARPGPWIQLERKYEPGAPGDLVDRIVGGVADGGRDMLHLATLYLLSAPGQEPGSEPDATWEPSVVHYVRWNQQYRTTMSDLVVEPTRVSIAVPQLGLGTLGAQAQPVVDEINRRTADLEAALRQVENFGTFSLA
jgi:hypothetical protein